MKQIPHNKSSSRQLALLYKAKFNVEADKEHRKQMSEEEFENLQDLIEQNEHVFTAGSQFQLPLEDLYTISRPIFEFLKTWKDCKEIKENKKVSLQEIKDQFDKISKNHKKEFEEQHKRELEECREELKGFGLKEEFCETATEKELNTLKDILENAPDDTPSDELKYILDGYFEALFRSRTPDTTLKRNTAEQDTAPCKRLKVENVLIGKN